MGIVKIFELYLRILRKQIWLYLAIFSLFILFIIWLPVQEEIFSFYRYAVIPVFLIVMMGVSTVRSVISRPEIMLRHRAAPIQPVYLELQSLGAFFSFLIVIWTLFLWSTVILYGESAYGNEGLLYTAALLAASLTAASIGLFFGTFAKSFQTRLTISSVAVLIFSLSGGIFSVFEPWLETDAGILVMSSFTPLLWYKRALEEASAAAETNGASFKNYIVFIGIQLIFSQAVLWLGMMLAKQKNAEI